MEPEKKIKIEVPFCVICQDDIKGDVAMCPHAFHSVCAVHFQDPDFDKKCPLCKVPMALMGPVHDLTDEKPQLDEDKCIMLQLMRLPHVTLQQMNEWYTRSVWEDKFYYSAEFEDAQRAALASDRNWAFFTHHVEKAYQQDRHRTLHYVCESDHGWNTLVVSPRFWQCVLPLMGKEMLMMLTRSLDALIMRPFKEMALNCCEIIAQYMREQGYRIHNDLYEVIVMRRDWLSFSLPMALELCNMLGFELEYLDFVYVAGKLCETAAITYFMDKFPAKTALLWNALFPTNCYEPEWKDRSPDFIQEVLKLRPLGWSFYGSTEIPWLRAFSPVLVMEDQKVAHYSLADWKALGAASPKHTLPLYTVFNDGQFFFADNVQVTHTREVTNLYIMRFEDELRVYHSGRKLNWVTTYEQAAKALKYRRICQSPGLCVKFKQAVLLKYCNKPF